MIDFAFPVLILGLVAWAMMWAAYWCGYSDGHAEGGEFEARRMRGELSPD